MDPHSKLLRTWELKGGISTQVTALEVLLSGGHTKKLIVRQHGATDLKHNPQIAADEFNLLQLVHSAGVAVPEPYYLDQSGEIFSMPYLVIEYIEGKPEFAPADLPDLLLQLAMHLSRTHQVDGSKQRISCAYFGKVRIIFVVNGSQSYRSRNKGVSDDSFVRECVYYSPRTLLHTGSLMSLQLLFYEFQCVNV